MTSVPVKPGGFTIGDPAGGLSVHEICTGPPELVVAAGELLQANGNAVKQGRMGNQGAIQFLKGLKKQQSH